VPRAVAYIAEVVKPPYVVDHIANKHGIADWEVDEAVVLTRVQAAWWSTDPERGARLMVVGTTYQGRTLLVVLRPLNELDGKWRLVTAMRGDAEPNA
jgi:hypothetical protein